MALASGGQTLQDTLRRYRNEDFACFDDILSAFLSEQQGTGLTGVCVAIAGPVRDGYGVLTNRAWRLDAHAIARVAGTREAVLINDLAAMGHAVPYLLPDQTCRLRKPAHSAQRNGQAFVLGLGTGVNLAASIHTGPALAVLEAEAGHAALPASVRDRLQEAVGTDEAKRFLSVEELLAGRGLSALYACLSGKAGVPAHDVLAGTDDVAAEAIALYARLLGLVLAELILFYLPMDGIHLAGSVARGVLGRAPDAFLEALNRPHLMADIIAGPGISLILEDAAALTGCAARLQTRMI